MINMIFGRAVFLPPCFILFCAMCFATIFFVGPPLWHGLERHWPSAMFSWLGFLESSFQKQRRPKKRQKEGSKKRMAKLSFTVAPILGACAMTTQFLDNEIKICTFKIKLSWRFPRKTAFWKIFLSAPKAPLKTRKCYFYCRLAVSEVHREAPQIKKHTNTHTHTHIIPAQVTKQVHDWHCTCVGEMVAFFLRACLFSSSWQPKHFSPTGPDRPKHSKRNSFPSWMDPDEPAQNRKMKPKEPKITQNPPEHQDINKNKKKESILLFKKDQKGSKTIKHDQERSETIKSDQERPKNIKNDRKWSKTIKNDQKRSNNDQKQSINNQKESKRIKENQKESRIIKNNQKQSKWVILNRLFFFLIFDFRAFFDFLIFGCDCFWFAVHTLENILKFLAQFDIFRVFLLIFADFLVVLVSFSVRWGSFQFGAKFTSIWFVFRNQESGQRHRAKLLIFSLEETTRKSTKR